MRQTLVVKFEVKGDLRFCSHQEMLRLWHRALVRAGVNLAFSQGFNPHPKISLPLPRPVGLESDDEIACIAVESPENAPVATDIAGRSIAEQLPEGIRLVDVQAVAGKKSMQPQAASFILPLSDPARLEKVRQQIEQICSKLANKEEIIVPRRINERGTTKNINISEYIEAIEVDARGIEVRCRITGAGSVRFDEIESILNIDDSMLDTPARRTRVAWN